MITNKAGGQQLSATAERSYEKSNSGRVLPALLMGVVAVCAALAYTAYAISTQPEAEKEPAQVQIPKVTVLPVTAGTYASEVQAMGEVRAVDEITLSSQLTGQVVWRNPVFVAGGQVPAGEVLIRLSQASYAASVAAARQALAEASLALQEEQRQNVQARQDWQRSGIKDEPGELVLRTPQLKVAKARYNAAKASLAQAREDLANTEIKAPFDAVIVSRLVGEGSYLQPGDQLASLRAVQRAEINLALSQQQWLLLANDPVGTEVTLRSAGQPGVSWQGTVARLADSLDTATRLRTLVVAVEQPLQQSPPLLFGDFVEARFSGRRFRDVFALPVTALSPRSQIWVVEDSQLQALNREALFSRNGQVYVARDTLPDAVQLVKQPVGSYLPGMKVEAVKAEPVAKNAAPGIEAGSGGDY